MKFTIYISIIAAFIFLSCESSVQDFKLKTATPKLVLNSFNGKNEHPKILVTRNMLYIEDEKLNPQLNAIVELYENGNLISILKPNGENWFEDN